MLGCNSKVCRRFHKTHDDPWNVILENLLRNDGIATRQPERCYARLNDVDRNCPVRAASERIERYFELIIKTIWNRQKNHRSPAIRIRRFDGLVSNKTSVRRLQIPGDSASIVRLGVELPVRVLRGVRVGTLARVVR